MYRFQFRLETVLGWRRLQVEAEEVKLRGLFEELRRGESARERVEKERAEAERGVLYAASPSATELTALEAHRAHAARELRRLRGERLQCEQRIATQRERLVEAERGMRLLEKLREKQLAEWNRAANREQEAAAAELFLGQLTRGGAASQAARGSQPRKWRPGRPPQAKGLPHEGP
jgi:flagellar export protein FliJ